VLKNPKEASAFVAREIANLIKDRESKGKSTVLGLATGSTPIGVY
jgi:glucosamine-6-phosphate deaminase